MTDQEIHEHLRSLSPPQRSSLEYVLVGLQRSAERWRAKGGSSAARAYGIEQSIHKIQEYLRK